MRSLCTSILYLYEIVVVNSKSDLGLALLSTVETTLKACSVETEFEGRWDDGVRQIGTLLESLQEMTPKRWKKAGTQIQQLLDSIKPFRRRMF